MSAPTAAQHHSLLAFDFGSRRIGAAVGNTLTGSARPLQTLSADAHALEMIAQLVSSWQPDALVVGVPRHPDGAAHANTRRARRFARELEARFGLVVHEVDERYTTTEALSRGSTDVDATAAAIILQQFLDARAHASTLR